MAVAYSVVAATTPRATTAICPRYAPERLFRTTSSSPHPVVPGMHPWCPPLVLTAEHTSKLNAIVETTVARRSQIVLGTDRTFVHSARSVRAARPLDIAGPYRPGGDEEHDDGPGGRDGETAPRTERRCVVSLARDLDRQARRRRRPLEQLAGGLR
jgi:hypothetical protein